MRHRIFINLQLFVIHLAYKELVLPMIHVTVLKDILERDVQSQVMYICICTVRTLCSFKNFICYVCLIEIQI